VTNPTFVAAFSDGTTTRMTTYHDAEHKTFDLARGIKLARHAYRQRTGKEPPVISAAWLDDMAGTVLEKYDPKQIAEATHDQRHRP